MREGGWKGEGGKEREREGVRERMREGRGKKEVLIREREIM